MLEAKCADDAPDVVVTVASPPSRPVAVNRDEQRLDSTIGPTDIIDKLCEVALDAATCCNASGIDVFRRRCGEWEGWKSGGGWALTQYPATSGESIRPRYSGVEFSATPQATLFSWWDYSSFGV